MLGESGQFDGSIANLRNRSQCAVKVALHIIAEGIKLQSYAQAGAPEEGLVAGGRGAQGLRAEQGSCHEKTAPRYGDHCFPLTFSGKQYLRAPPYALAPLQGANRCRLANAPEVGRGSVARSAR